MENIVPIFATIAMQSSTHPHKKAIVFGESTFSLLELETLSNQVAHYLLECYPNTPKGNKLKFNCHRAHIKGREARFELRHKVASSIIAP